MIADVCVSQFEVRFCPALAKKPTSDEAKDEADTDKPKPVDVFAPPYQPLLYVAEDTIKEDDDDEGEQFVVLVTLTRAPPATRSRLHTGRGPFATADWASC